jgi:hypothetical protein
MGDSSLTGYDVVVVGGGFFGCCLALHLEERFGCAVALVEREKSLLQRASYANQARVHNGYHYPRSFLTALRCRMNFRRFISDFRDCVVANFEKYYAIGKNFSKVTARQYREFCSRIGAPLAPAPTRIRKLFDPHLIEDVFAVEECAFDAVKLARMIEDEAPPKQDRAVFRNRSNKGGTTLPGFAGGSLPLEGPGVPASWATGF